MAFQTSYILELSKYLCHFFNAYISNVLLWWRARSVSITPRAEDTFCVASSPRHEAKTATYQYKTLGSSHVCFALTRCCILQSVGSPDRYTCSGMIPCRSADCRPTSTHHDGRTPSQRLADEQLVSQALYDASLHARDAQSQQVVHQPRPGPDQRHSDCVPQGVPRGLPSTGRRHGAPGTAT